MTIVVMRSFTLEPGSFGEFERISKEGIWPYYEARGCKVMGLYENVHGGATNEAVVFTAYDSLAHWESTQLDVAPPPECSDEVRRLAGVATESAQLRGELTTAANSRILRLATDWVHLRVHSG